jgi:tetratricopeptide (TPR) repeat protein
MVSRNSYRLFLELDENIFEFFPDAAGKDQAAFREAVTQRVRAAFAPLKGVIQAMSVSDARLEVAWQRTSDKVGPVNSIVEILKKGDYADGMLLLELFLSADPRDTDLLYNLGMAYSDRNKLERAIDLLTQLVEIEPGHVNGRVALGVALLRNNRNEAGIKELGIAVEKEPGNLWARRNLGAGLMRVARYAEAGEHLRAATEIAPNDPAAWFGYGQALEALEKPKEADEAYIKAIQLDEFGQVAERAKEARSKLAQTSFRAATPGILRMDAVMYCLGALEKFAGMTGGQVQKIGFEIAILGTRGLDVNSSEQKYSLRSLPGKFSGLHLLCLQYVAFKQIAPGHDIGFDLSAEYKTALGMFEEASR